jgi:hypothetical protein
MILASSPGMVFCENANKSGVFAKSWCFGEKMIRERPKPCEPQRRPAWVKDLMARRTVAGA